MSAPSSLSRTASRPADPDVVDARLRAGAALVAGLAHELRNALAAADSSLYLAARAGDHGARRAHEDVARTHVRAAQDLVTRALQASRGEPIAIDASPVADIVAVATRGARGDAATHLLVEVVPEDLEVRGDPLLLARAVENLVDNARDVARGAGREGVHVHVHARAAEGGVEVRVDDDGPGIDPRVAGRLFEPLVTARPGGTGLGLRFVRAVAELHGGRAEGGDRPGGGASFAIVIPAPDPSRFAVSSSG